MPKARATAAAREADRAEAYAWSIRMEGYGGPAQPSPTIGQCPSTADSVASKLSAIAVRPAQACAGRFPSTARHADLEAGTDGEMAVMQEGPLRTTGAYDQADRDP